MVVMHSFILTEKMIIYNQQLEQIRILLFSPGMMLLQEIILIKGLSLALKPYLTERQLNRVLLETK